MQKISNAKEEFIEIGHFSGRLEIAIELQVFDIYYGYDFERYPD
jgi:hypothetical protein